MPTQSMYIQESFETNLFFLRILKEHALFMQLSFTPKNKALGNEAENLRRRFDGLLRQVIRRAKGYVGRRVMDSGELFTRFTLEAERSTQYFTGVPIDMKLTEEEYNLGGGAMPPVTMQGEADTINRNALALAQELLQFKERVYQDVVSCKIITMLYPHNIDHTIRENRHYITMLQNLMARDLTLNISELADEEAFWNDIMGEHAEFIDGLLDPTEKSLKDTARMFAMEFGRLQEEANAARNMLQMVPETTMKSEDATAHIRDFKTQGTQGILSCQIRSIINPLLSDHVLREANHYLRILQRQVL
jgi:hypothetical protein